ncbi:MAG: GNAT family N-acetyltransferase [Streptosporangiales bacterium]|nr:GNAT family N-acetyltransferase [Streptosporangiales bacterium]
MDRADMEIRRYRPTDLTAVLGIAPRLTEGVAAWHEPQRVLDAVTGWVGAYPETAARDSVAVFLPEDAGAVIGLIGVSERRHFTGETEGYVGELVVSSTSARQGVGRALMGAAEDSARQRGHGRVTLDTGWDNATAREFYAALGYEAEGVRLSKPVH